MGTQKWKYPHILSRQKVSHNKSTPHYSKSLPHTLSPLSGSPPAPPDTLWCSGKRNGFKLGFGCFCLFFGEVSPYSPCMEKRQGWGRGQGRLKRISEAGGGGGGRDGGELEGEGVGGDAAEIHAAFKATKETCLLTLPPATSGIFRRGRETFWRDERKEGKRANVWRQEDKGTQ